MYNNDENNVSLSIDDQTLLTIMNSKKHRSAKSFKSPPQPKFCVKESTSDGKLSVFINVLSYSRIANQLSENDPVNYPTLINAKKKRITHSSSLGTSLWRYANSINQFIQKCTSSAITTNITAAFC